MLSIKTTFSRVVIGLLALAQMMNLTSCSQIGLPSSNPASAPAQAVPAQTASPVVAAATRTPLPPLNTPTLFPTATWAATSTPDGMYSNYDLGMSVVFSNPWFLSSTKTNDVVLFNPVSGLGIVLWSRVEKKASSIEDVLKEVNGDYDKSTSVKQWGRGEFEIADSIKVPYVDYRVEGSLYLDERLAVIHQGERTYAFAIFAGEGDLKMKSGELDKVLKTLRLVVPHSFGLPHDQTLYSLWTGVNFRDLDPALTSDSAGGYVGQIFSGLVRLSPDLKIVPALAESWKVSPDGRVYTFTIPLNLKFSNGMALTAQEVKDSWERACDPKTGSSTARIYLGDIVGVKERLDGKARDVQGVKVVDPNTLEVTLDGPKPYFLAKLTHPAAFVVRVKDVKPDEEWVLTAAASGPYVIQKQVNGAAIILERNENSPVKSQIRYRVYLLSQGIAPLSMYQAGDIDILPVQLDDWAEVNDAKNPLHVDFHSGPSMCTELLQLNPNVAPMDDANVRKAFALATDPAALVLKLSKNIDLQANSILPPSMPGYLAGRAAPVFDPQAAKEALAASKYASNLPAIVLVASGFGDTQRTDVATLADMWRKNLGVKVQVQYVDPADFVKNARVAAGQMTLLSWCADYPDPENFLNVLYASTSETNVGHVSDPDLDALLEKAGVEEDTGKRLELYQQAESLILDQVYAIPMSHTMLGMLVKPRVKGFVLSPLTNVVLGDMSLEPEWNQ